MRKILRSVLICAILGVVASGLVAQVCTMRALPTEHSDLWTPNESEQAWWGEHHPRDSAETLTIASRLTRFGVAVSVLSAATDSVAKPRLQIDAKNRITGASCEVPADGRFWDQAKRTQLGWPVPFLETACWRLGQPLGTELAATSFPNDDQCDWQLMSRVAVYPILTTTANVVNTPSDNPYSHRKTVKFLPIGLCINSAIFAMIFGILSLGWSFARRRV